MDTEIKMMEERTPLIRFSLYTAVQVQSLKNVGEEIVGLSKDWTEAKTDYRRVYDLFWLWILGAYEVLRTMDAHKDCFADLLQPELSAQKIYLARIRMPFAKQQLRGDQKGSVYNELSVTGIEKGLNFDITGDLYNSTVVVEKFLKFIDNIKPQDIVSGMPVAFPEKP